MGLYILRTTLRYIARLLSVPQLLIFSRILGEVPIYMIFGLSAYLCQNRGGEYTPIILYKAQQCTLYYVERGRTNSG
jgi:hypothetical protein